MKKYDNFKLAANRPLKDYPYAELIQMLSLKYEQATYDHHVFRQLALEELLLTHAQPRLEEAPLQKLSVLVVVGQTSFKSKELKARLETLGIQLKRALSKETTHVLLGLNPKTSKGLENHSCTLLSEQQLQEALDRLEAPFLKGEEASASLEHLEQLLLSKSEEQRTLALELLKGGGLPKKLIPAAFIAMKFTDDKKLYAKFKRLIKPMVSDASMKIFQQRHLFKAKTSEAFLSESLQKYSNRNSDLDGLEVATLLFKYYQKGVQYIWQYAQGTDLSRRCLDAFLEGKKLDLSKLRIAHLPNDLAELKGVEELDLSQNSFKQIPKALALMPNLKSLNLSSNPLGGLGKQLGAVRTLKNLNISGCQLKYWKTPLLRKMTYLKALTVSNYYNNDPETPKRQADLKAILATTKITFI